MSRSLRELTSRMLLADRFGSRIATSDGLVFEEKQPQWSTLNRLDSELVWDTSNESFVGMLSRVDGFDRVFNCAWGDVRAHVYSGDDVKVPVSVFECLAFRLSSWILCKECGGALIVKKKHVACEKWGCLAFAQREPQSMRMARKVFRDRLETAEVVAGASSNKNGSRKPISGGREIVWPE